MIPTDPLSIKIKTTASLTCNEYIFRNVSLYCEVMDGNTTHLTGVTLYRYATYCPSYIYVI